MMRIMGEYAQIFANICRNADMRINLHQCASANFGAWLTLIMIDRCPKEKTRHLLSVSERLFWCYYLMLVASCLSHLHQSDFQREMQQCCLPRITYLLWTLGSPDQVPSDQENLRHLLVPSPRRSPTVGSPVDSSRHAKTWSNYSISQQANNR